MPAKKKSNPCKSAPKSSRRGAKKKDASALGGAPMVVDGELVRRAARQENEEVRSRMESTERQLRKFEEKEKPAFQRWLYMQFGPTLLELRKIWQDLTAKADIIDRVEEYRFLYNVSRVQAYARVKSDLEAPGSREATENSDDFANIGYDRMSEEDLRKAYESFREAFKEGTGFDVPDFDVFKNDLGMCAGIKSQAEDDSHKAKTKKLYHRIARCLHPDCGGQFSLRDQRLWHRAQEAYKAGDTVTLETVLSHLEATNAGPLFASTVSELMENTKEMRRRMQGLATDLRNAKKDPAWGFTRKTQRQLQLLHGRLKWELEETLEQARIELADAEAEIRRLDIALERTLANNKVRHNRKGRPGALQESLPF